MLPIYLYKKMMLEKKASSDQDYIKLAKLMEKLADPLRSFPYGTQSLYVSPTPFQPGGVTLTSPTTPLPPPTGNTGVPVPPRLSDAELKARLVTPRLSDAELKARLVPPRLPNAPYNSLGEYKLMSKPTPYGKPLVWAVSSSTPPSVPPPPLPSVPPTAPNPIESAAEPATFREKVKGTWSNLKARGADLLSKLKGGGGRLRALLGLGSLIAGYSALNMAEPYFVRRLRESAYGGPDIYQMYTTPTIDLLRAAESSNPDQESGKFFDAIDQRFNQLRQGNYAPGVFDPVTGSFNDYRKKSTIFSPIWNALRYLNIFSSHSAPVYEKHYRTPQEFLHSLEQYANQLDQEISMKRPRMTERQLQAAQQYLFELKGRIQDYRNLLGAGGAGYSGIL